MTPFNRWGCSASVHDQETPTVRAFTRMEKGSQTMASAEVSSRRSPHSCSRSHHEGVRLPTTHSFSLRDTGDSELEGSSLRICFFPAFFTFPPQKEHFPQTSSLCPYITFQSLGYFMKYAAAFSVCPQIRIFCAISKIRWENKCMNTLHHSDLQNDS